MGYEPCLPVISILAHRARDLSGAVSHLTDRWDQYTLIGPGFLFDETDYYGEELGYPLLRWWGFRDQLANPAELKEWKQTCSEIEDNLRDNDDNRTVNIDPGYINYGLLVLGSHKYDLQKIYLGDGVYADPVLQYGDGEFKPFPWSFPDFKQDTYYSLLEEIRDRYSEHRNS